MAPRFRWVVFVSCAIVPALATSTAWAKPRVEMVLSQEQGIPITGPQQWLKFLTERGVDNVQIRGAQGDDAASIELGGSKQSPIYRVTGRLTARNTLVLPGKEFNLGDATGLTRWLTELSDNGIDGVTQAKTAYGLTPKQFAQLRADLAKPVDFATKQMPAAQVIERLKAKLTTPIAVDAAAAQALAAEEPVRDELQGVARGTALAAVLRPAGMVLVPQKQGARDLELTIASAKGAKDSWPIGWPPQAEAAVLVPMLFNPLDAELEDITAADALAALQSRLKTPLLFDHNAMVKHKVDLTTVKVNLPNKRTYYNRVLQQVLGKAGLQNELRIDDAGKPMFWITTLKN